VNRRKKEKASKQDPKPQFVVAAIQPAGTRAQDDENPHQEEPGTEPVQIQVTCPWVTLPKPADNESGISVDEGQQYQGDHSPQ
jgi:hypothetical protein